ncbi:MAG: hypothetical protein KGZ41_01595 [Dethiobacter sp.]|jgi:uncharacterized membrane protein YecN with MAPEG domain|nr:hypothetical protein [Dethiobacter sp.]MBS3982473.1 hypothetical protein [Dethiobacter sp.]
MTLMVPLFMLPMFLIWFVGVIFLVAAVLAVNYYVVGKDEEYRRAKGVAVKMFCIAFVLIVLALIYLVPMRG